MSAFPIVEIHYLRPPAHLEVYRQLLIYEDADVHVTFARGVKLKRPMMILGQPALEPGSDIVWFTFPGRWHDIGRFHLADGTFTGVYANVLTPPRFEPGNVWHTTDLFLDVWIPPGGTAEVLDREEFEHALREGWIDEATAARALDEAENLRTAAAASTWPPPIVAEWTLERVRGLVAAGG